MKRSLAGFVLVASLVLAGCAEPRSNIAESASDCDFSATGRNDFFILEPGWTLMLAGEEDGAAVEVKLKVVDETEVVDNVTTRVLVEEERVGGELVELSRNFLAFCPQTRSVYYFGEEVDDYEAGEVTGHGGAWRAGVDGARAGVLMPGAPALGLAHYQEQAPGVAMDFAEIVGVDENVSTPAENFTGALKVKETTPLEQGVVAHKWYARGVGLVVDGPARLVWYGRE